MTGSALSLGVEEDWSSTEPNRPEGALLRDEAEGRSVGRGFERTWESRRIKEEVQEIMSPTPLELLKVWPCVYDTTWSLSSLLYRWYHYICSKWKSYVSPDFNFSVQLCCFVTGHRSC